MNPRPLRGLSASELFSPDAIAFFHRGGGDFTATDASQIGESRVVAQVGGQVSEQRFKFLRRKESRCPFQRCPRCP
jgi:hypothetical protein